MGSLNFGRGFLIMLATAVAAGVAFYVLREHGTHALGLAPYLLFLACPLMHFFMHRGHKRADGSAEARPAKKQHSAGCH